MMYIVLPFISAMIGWFTNFIALRMLFYPRVEKRYLGIVKVQGIFPKRKPKLANRLANIVSKELFTVEMIRAKVDNDATKKKIRDSVEVEIEKYLEERVKEMNRIVATFINEKRRGQIKDVLCNEFDKLMPRLMDELGEKLKEVDIHKIVYEKVNGFSNEKVEEIMLGVIKNEMKFIEWAGAVLGFLVGVLQVGLLFLAKSYGWE